MRPRIEARWSAKSGALLKPAAGSVEVGVVHSRRIVESVVLMSGMLLPYSVLPSVMLSAISSTVAWQCSPHFLPPLAINPPLSVPLAEQAEWA